mgnify:CR=1 FL=1
MKIKINLWKELEKYRRYRKMDKAYKLFSQFGFDGFDKHAPSYYFRMEPEILEKISQKELDNLKNILEQCRR